MSKETTIIFVYDTKSAPHPDDLTSPIVYFHPTWVSDQQKTALCGQLMGTVHCFKNIFAPPKIVALQSGKFCIREYGRYLLAVGTDQNIADWLLEHRAAILSSLITFFHQDIEVMARDVYEHDNGRLSAKLYQFFETYLKYLFVGGNVFTYVPSIRLPKSASNVFLEAIHILQSCQERDFVLGGALFYHNKVVATQLSPDLTKRLVLTDPYRIRCSAEMPAVDFDLPLGVQLLQVYISNKEFCDLHEEATRCRSISQFISNKDFRKLPSKPPITKEPVLTALKRDQSLIFTSVPEEDCSCIDHSDSHDQQTSTVNVTKSALISNGGLQNRPKFLNLKSKTTTGLLDNYNSKRISSVSETTVTATTTNIQQYNNHGQSTTTPSVCSTPLTDLNKVVHQKAMSICLNPLNNNLILEKNHNFSNNDDDIIITSPVHETNNISSLNNDNKLVPYLNITRNLYDCKRLTNSVIDLRDCNNSDTNLINNKLCNDDDIPVVGLNNKVFKTITDPTFPVFRSDGTIVSRSFYNDYVANHLTDLITSQFKKQPEPSKPANVNDHHGITPHHHFDDFDDSMRLEDFVKSVAAPISSTTTTKESTENIEIPTITPLTTAKDKQRRKSLNLPLKPLGTGNDDNDDKQSSPSNCYRASGGGGVQLTPLMWKLSSFTIEERTSGFCSRDGTPMYTPTATQPPTFPFSFNAMTKLRRGTAKYNDNNEGTLQKCVLFVCGQQDMVVCLLLQEDSCKSQELIEKLWELCTENLGKLEKQLHHCLEIYPSGSSMMQSDTEPYSYLCLDPEWDTVQRGGPWGTTELGALTCLHRDFKEKSNLTEILMRHSDGVIYGVRSAGQSEVYYHQSAGSNAGLPTPADPMGNVVLKARRRLERDHAIILM